MRPEDPYTILGRMVLEWIQGEPMAKVIARQEVREKLYAGVDTDSDCGREESGG